MNGLEYITEYRYRPMPTAPNEVLIYAKRKITDKSFEMKEGYWRNRVFLNWFDQLSKWRAECSSNYHFLKHLLITAPDDMKYTIQSEIDKFNQMEWAILGWRFIKELASYNAMPPNYQDTN